MKSDKIQFLKEKQIQKKAQETAEFLENRYAQNPIKAKLNAFLEAKKSIKIKDLF